MITREEKDYWLAQLRERIVFDIGQIPTPVKEWLIREVRKGRVQRTWNTQRYPEGKFMYWIADPASPMRGTDGASC